MSAQDPRPAPRRRKLVLRKIGEGAAPSPAESGKSYSGPQPTIRPRSQAPDTIKSRQALTLPLASEPELEPEPEEIEPEESVAIEDAPAQVSAPAAWVNYAEEDWHPSEEAGAAAAMTPAAPSAVRLPARSSHSWLAAAVPAAPTFPPPARSAAPAAPETSSRPSVAPVVATLPPIGMAPRLAPVRAAMSADSKLLAVGGALAAAMLLVAVGVLLGQRSTGSTPSAGATASYPLVVETRAPASGALPAATRPIRGAPGHGRASGRAGRAARRTGDRRRAEPSAGAEAASPGLDRGREARRARRDGVRLDSRAPGRAACRGDGSVHDGQRRSRRQPTMRRRRPAPRQWSRRRPRRARTRRSTRSCRLSATTFVKTKRAAAAAALSSATRATRATRASSQSRQSRRSFQRARNWPPARKPP